MKIRISIFILSIFLFQYSSVTFSESSPPNKKVKTTVKKSIFADPENLKILPEKITPQQLRATMKEFSMALGLRCNNCHVGEPGKPLTTYDFASDDKKLKNKARVMLNMVKNINSVQLLKLDEIEKNARVNVQCVTCHRGQRKPELIQSVLADALVKDGVNGVLDKYTKLRGKYYGSHTFDFSENVLPLFSGEQMAGKSHVNSVVTLLEANREYFPDSFFGTFSLAGAYQKAGDKEKAIAAYEKALKINPKAQFIRIKLEALTQ